MKDMLSLFEKVNIYDSYWDLHEDITRPTSCMPKNSVLVIDNENKHILYGQLILWNEFYFVNSILHETTWVVLIKNTDLRKLKSQLSNLRMDKEEIESLANLDEFIEEKTVSNDDDTINSLHKK